MDPLEVRWLHNSKHFVSKSQAVNGNVAHQEQHENCRRAKSQGSELDESGKGVDVECVAATVW